MRLKKLIQVRLLKGSLYQASVEFLRHLAFKYQTKAENACQEHGNLDAFAKASRLLESAYDYSEISLEVTDEDREDLQIWSCLTQKEELELVARSIRQKLHQEPKLSY